MDWLRQRLFWVVVLVPLAGPLSLSACEEQGPAEEAGEAIDETVEGAGDRVEEATD